MYTPKSWTTLTDSTEALATVMGQPGSCDCRRADGHHITSVFVTDALAILHWLCVPERVNFKLAPMAYRVLNGMAL